MFKKYYKEFIIIILLVVIFLMNTCGGSDKQTQKVKIKTPEVIGKIDKPSVILHHKSTHDSIVYKKGKTIYTENPFNKELAEAFKDIQKENDSLKLFTIYLKAIQERSETRVFDNGDITVKVLTKTRGEILDQSIDYKIKPREIKVDIPNKNSVFVVYVGGGLKSNINVGDLSPTGMLGIQNRKGNLLFVQYGLDRSVQVGYSFRIINIKK